MAESRGTLRVLIVEDYEPDADLIVRTLKRAGYTVACRRVETAAEMQAALQAAAWDIIISDYRLPQFDALQVLALAQSIEPDLPVIIVSGTIQEVEAVTALRAGAQDFVTKSNLTRLAPAVERELRDTEHRRAHRAAQEALRQQEASFRLLFENNPLPMWVYDRETLAFLEVNHAAVARYGYSRDEFLSMDITQIRPPEDVPRLMANVTSQRPELVPPQPHWRHRLKDGRVIDVEITAHALTFHDRPAVLVVANDITERSQAAEAVARSERRFRALIENSADAITLIGPDGTVIYDSPAAPGLLGYSETDWIGRNALNLVHPDDLSRVQAALQQMVAEPAQPVRLQFRLRRSDGAWRWMEAVASNLLAEPSVQAIVVNYRDVTEQREAEARVRFQAHLLETVGQAVIATDLEGRIIFWNPYAEALFGWTAGEVLGRRLREVAPSAEGAKDSEAILAALRANRIWKGELVLQRKDGTWFPAQVTDRPVFDDAGRPVGMIGITEDITERKQAAEALARSEHRFRALIENSADAITLVDANGTTIYDSPTVSKMLGYSPDELAGQNVFDRMHPDDRPEARAKLRQCLEDASTPVLGQLRLQHRSGEWRWIEYMATNLLAEPAVEAVVINYRDITERKAAEAQIQRHLEQLAALRAIDQAITSSLDLRLTLTVFLDQVISQLNVDAADVLLLDSGSQMLTYTAGRGFRSSQFQQTSVRLGEGRAGRAALERRIISEQGLDRVNPSSMRTGMLGRDKFVSYYGVPLIAKGQVVGVLELFHRTPLQPDAAWLEFLEALAGQAAIAVENATLFSGLQRTHQDLVLAYEATIEGWARALDLRDKETEGHSRRVTDLTLRLARALGVSDADLVHIRRGALLHDVGKIGIPDHILLKPGPLNDDEWAIMRQHPTFAFELLSPIDFLRPALEIPYCHHEKWDGTGYPRGLRGEQIPLSARLFAVVDVWDALRSDRPYRPAWSEARVLEHIRSQAGSHFDPRAVEVFLQEVGQGI